MTEKKVISLEEIKQKALGTVIEISDWEPGKKICVRVNPVFNGIFGHATIWIQSSD
jgi:hypothetical protein